jgi:hypothetical protein
MGRIVARFFDVGTGRLKFSSSISDCLPFITNLKFEALQLRNRWWELVGSLGGRSAAWRISGRTGSSRPFTTVVHFGSGRVHRESFSVRRI